MALTLDSAESRLSEEMEREHEIRNLKETVGALREALEKQKAGTASEVAQAVAEAHGGRLQLDEGPGSVDGSGPGLRVALLLPAA